ncbi:ubiquitin elongating factor core domain-containing protein [Phthorimaea operculella]|nr:ubiquitin elongating factor core domain-containing protein [Phthorimaea operculella]
MSELSQEEIRRRRLARLAALSSPATPASPPVTPGASAPDAQPSPQTSPAPAPREPTTAPDTPTDATNANKEPPYSNGDTKNKVSDNANIPADGLIVTDKTDNNLLDEMPDTKMTDLSQTRQYNSFDSMGEDALLLSCGSVRMPQSTVGGSEGASTREDSTSRSVTPPQFVEPSPVRPRPNASPSCSRRSLSMEVDDVSERNSQSEQQSEPMDVEDNDSSQSPARKISRPRTISYSELTEDQLRHIVAKILQVSWSEDSAGGIFVPSVAASLLDNPKLSLDEIASEAIMDVIMQIADGSDPLNQKLIAISETTKRLSEDCSDETLTAGPLGSETDAEKPAEAGTCPAPSLPIPNTMASQGLAVSYLLKFYNNINLYERDYPKKSSEPPLSDLLQSLRTMLVNHLVLVLQGGFELEKCRKSPLLPYILIGNTPIGLIPELVEATYLDKEVFEEVFIPLLMGIREHMRRCVSPLVGRGHGAALRALRSLCDLRCGPRHSVRPVCSLIARLPSLCPDSCTTAPGREIARASFLGPFFAISLFAEENPRLAERLFASDRLSGDRSLAFALQREVEASRNTLHNICHNILLCPDAREPFLNYFAQLLQRNERRAQLQTDERSLAAQRAASAAADRRAVASCILLCPDAREPFLNYFAQLLQRNERRAQLQTDERSLAGECTFLNNICYSILLCPDAREPFLNYFAQLLQRNERRAQLQTEERSLAGECTFLIISNICYNILLCPDAREPFLNYFAQLLQRNERRAQLQTDERSLAGECTFLIISNICYSILLCPDAREPFLNYFAQLLQRNERRAQLQTDERSLAGECTFLIISNICYSIPLCPDAREPFLNYFAQLLQRNERRAQLQTDERSLAGECTFLTHHH